MYRDLIRNEQVLRYIVAYNSFYFANGLASSFINIFFFGTGNLLVVLQFQISYQISQLFMFIISSGLSNYLKTKHIYAIGTLVRALSLLSVVIIGGIFYNQFFFGIIYGISGGLYWAGNAVISLDVSRGTNRLNFLSLKLTVSYFVSLIAPTLGGIALELTPFRGVLRYLILFLSAAILLIYSAVQIELITTNKVKTQKVKLIDSIRADKNIKWAFKSYFVFSSVYLFALSIFLPVYVFEITKEYTIVGLLAALMAGSGAIGNVFSPNLLEKGRKRLPYIYGGIIIASSMVFLDIKLYPIILSFLAGGAAMFFAAPINNRSMSNFMNSIDQVATSFPYWVNREYYVLVGRLLVLLSFLFLISTSGISLYMPVLAIMSLSIIPMLTAVNIDS